MFMGRRMFLEASGVVWQPLAAPGSPWQPLALGEIYVRWIKARWGIKAGVVGYITCVYSRKSGRID